MYRSIMICGLMLASNLIAPTSAHAMSCSSWGNDGNRVCKAVFASDYETLRDAFDLKQCGGMSSPDAKAMCLAMGNQEGKCKDILDAGSSNETEVCDEYQKLGTALVAGTHYQNSCSVSGDAPLDNFCEGIVNRSDSKCNALDDPAKASCKSVNKFLDAFTVAMKKAAAEAKAFAALEEEVDKDPTVGRLTHLTPTVRTEDIELDSEDLALLDDAEPAPILRRTTSEEELHSLEVMVDQQQHTRKKKVFRWRKVWRNIKWRAEAASFAITEWQEQRLVDKLEAETERLTKDIAIAYDRTVDDINEQIDRQDRLASAMMLDGIIDDAEEIELEKELALLTRTSTPSLAPIERVLDASFPDAFGKIQLKEKAEEDIDEASDLVIKFTRPVLTQ